MWNVRQTKNENPLFFITLILIQSSEADSGRTNVKVSGCCLLVLLPGRNNSRPRQLLFRHTAQDSHMPATLRSSHAG